MGVDCDCEGSCRVPQTRVRVRSSVSCTGCIGLWLELGSTSDVRTRTRLMFRFMVRHGVRQWCRSSVRSMGSGLGLGLVFGNVYGHDRANITLGVLL